MGLLTAPQFQTQVMSFHITGVTWHSATGGRLASVPPGHTCETVSVCPCPRSHAWAPLSFRWFCRISPMWPYVTQPLGSGTRCMPWAQCSLVRPRSCACAAPHVLLRYCCRGWAVTRAQPHTESKVLCHPKGCMMILTGLQNPQCPFLHGDLHCRACQSPAINSKLAILLLGVPLCDPARRPEESLFARLMACKAQGHLLRSKCRYKVCFRWGWRSTHECSRASFSSLTTGSPSAEHLAVPGLGL